MTFSGVLWVFNFCVDLGFLEEWGILEREVRSEEGEREREVEGKA